MFGRPLQFRERGDGGARGAGQLVIHFEQDGFVGLDDQRAVGH
jgi:hypothetical protein